MPYLKGSKLSDAQRASLDMPSEYIDAHCWFVCLDGSISKRHIPRRSPIDDHDIEVLLTALRYTLACPHRAMFEPEGTSDEHYHALCRYIESLKT